MSVKTILEQQLMMHKETAGHIKTNISNSLRAAESASATLVEYLKDIQEMEQLLKTLEGK